MRDLEFFIKIYESSPRLLDLGGEDFDYFGDFLKFFLKVADNI